MTPTQGEWLQLIPVLGTTTDTVQDPQASRTGRGPEHEGVKGPPTEVSRDFVFIYQCNNSNSRLHYHAEGSVHLFQVKTWR